MHTPVLHCSPSRTFDRPATVTATALDVPAKRVGSHTVMLVPALLLALVLARMIGLGFTMDRIGADVSGGDLVPVASEVDALPPAFDEVETGPFLAHGALAGIPPIMRAIASDPYAARKLPAPPEFLSEDGVPFQLRTSDFTGDAAICSRVMGGEAVGVYRFDFYDGGLTWDEEYEFLTFVTQSYRPASLHDPRLLLLHPGRRLGPGSRYVAR